MLLRHFPPFLATRFGLSPVVLEPFAWHSLCVLPRCGLVARVTAVVLLAERLGFVGGAGCAIMLAGILTSEPAAAVVLRRLARRTPEVA
ncbi:MAG: hypothetical protein EXQ81_03035 [Thermoleophilia bacterium]|nr:hypothetical protein [Thermoleophilia bacterium]